MIDFTCHSNKQKQKFTAVSITAQAIKNLFITNSIARNQLVIE